MIPGVKNTDKGYKPVLYSERGDVLYELRTTYPTAVDAREVAAVGLAEATARAKVVIDSTLRRKGFRKAP
jgi:hypothetical protein